MTRFKATYSQWEVYDTCPYQYYRLYTSDDKVERQKSDALEKGIRVHDQLEQFMLGATTTLPTEVHPTWDSYLADLREKGPQTEVRLDNDVAYGKLDVYLAGEFVGDFKTGKARVNDPKKRDQLRFYVWLAKEDLEASLLWVEHPMKNSIATINLKASPVLDTVWRHRIDTMQQDTKHEKKPSWKCNFCPVSDCERQGTWVKGTY